jgi:hypothetical protein
MRMQPGLQWIENPGGTNADALVRACACIWSCGVLARGLFGAALWTERARAQPVSLLEPGSR